MSWFAVDVESDGPIPFDYSMIALGASLVADPEVTFLGYLKPISAEWQPEALAVSGFTREETLEFPDPIITMKAFESWVLKHNKPGTQPTFTSDNNGYDWMFVCWYMWHYLGDCAFGFSSKNLNNIWQGMQRDSMASPRHLAITKHDHNPMHDAKGHAEKVGQMVELGFKVRNL